VRTNAGVEPTLGLESRTCCPPDDLPDASDTAIVPATMSSGGRVCTIDRMAVTVVIVDDHAGFRRAARAALESEGFVVLGDAADARSGYDLVASVGPEVVLVDIQLPDEDGFTLADRLAARSEAPIIVLISSRERATYLDRLARSGARGFIEKRDLIGATLDALIR